MCSCVGSAVNAHDIVTEEKLEQIKDLEEAGWRMWQWVVGILLLVEPELFSFNSMEALFSSEIPQFCVQLQELKEKIPPTTQLVLMLIPNKARWHLLVGFA